MCYNYGDHLLIRMTSQCVCKSNDGCQKLSMTMPLCNYCHVCVQFLPQINDIPAFFNVAVLFFSGWLSAAEHNYYHQVTIWMTSQCDMSMNQLMTFKKKCYSRCCFQTIVVCVCNLQDIKWQKWFTYLLPPRNPTTRDSCPLRSKVVVIF